MSEVRSISPAEALGYTAYILGGSVVVGLARVIYAAMHVLKHSYYESVYKMAINLERTEIDTTRDARADERQQENRDEFRNVRQRQTEERRAEREAKQAKGIWNNVTAYAKLGVKKAQTEAAEFKAAVVTGANEFIQAADDIYEDNINPENILLDALEAVIETKEQALREEWISQLALGCIELIPIIGGIIGTHLTLNPKERKIIEVEPSFLDLKALSQLYEVEKNLDELTAGFQNSVLSNVVKVNYEYNPWFH